MEALVNGSLPAPERALAEQHIAVCEGCRLELELVRAIGSQEKAPAAGKDDWTLDRIFGSEGSHQEASGPAAPVPAKPAPAAGPPSTFPATAPASSGGAPQPPAKAAPAGAGTSAFASAPMNPPESNAFERTPPSTADETEMSSGSDDEKEESSFGAKAAAGSPTSWDFEPADAKSDGGPSEESLFFANEALTRRKDPETKKTSSFRFLLWGAGGLIGAILLAFSSWFVLHMAAPETQDPQPRAGSQGSSATDSFPGDPGDPSPEDPLTPDPGLQLPDDGGGSSDAPDQTAKSAPVAQAPRVAASSAAPLPIGTRAPVPSTTQRVPAPTPSRPTPPPAVRTEPAGAASSSQALAGSTSRGTPPPPKVRRTPPIVAPKTDDDMIPSDDPPPSRGSHDGAGDPGHGSSDAASALDAGYKSTSPGTAAPSHQRITTPPPGKQPETEPAPAPDNSPIGKLHLATVTAEEEADLAGLRRLRSQWKSFMSKIVGPDRARAKREYADCLWAIQVLTGRRSDQKDALAAYREYLLGAPAGGADSRTVSRLRQLEDAITPGR